MKVWVASGEGAAGTCISRVMRLLRHGGGGLESQNLGFSPASGNIFMNLDKSLNSLPRAIPKIYPISYRLSCGGS